MIIVGEKKRFWKIAKKGLSFFISFTFFSTSIISPNIASAQNVPQTILNLPIPGTMLPTSAGFTPPLIKGLTINLENALEFDFIVYHGDNNLQGQDLKQESLKLIKYFLASLTTPEEEMWVNLSPYEQDRIIPEAFGRTEMGRDLLAQDYILKQLTASLMYPEDELGAKFWKKVYQKAYEQFGTTQIPVNTFNKVWIVPSKAVVYEHEGTALIVEQHLKVMLEEDYLALESNLENSKFGMDQMAENDVKDASKISSEIVRTVLIPAIEKEVNQGKNFANLRQIYNSMILAAWYKQNLKESLLGQVYVDQNRIKGVDVEDKDIKQKIYQQYLEAFKKGVYNYIKEDIDYESQEIIPRKYFSGGMRSQLEAKTLQTIGQGDISSGSPIRDQFRGVLSRIEGDRYSRMKVLALDVGDNTENTFELVESLNFVPVSPLGEGNIFTDEELQKRLQKAVNFYRGFIPPKSFIKQVETFAQLQLDFLGEISLQWFESLGIVSFERAVGALLNSEKYEFEVQKSLARILQNNTEGFNGKKLKELILKQNIIQKKYLDEFESFDQKALQRSNELLVNLFHDQLKVISGSFAYEYKKMNYHMVERSGEVDIKIFSYFLEEREKRVNELLLNFFGYVPTSLVYPNQFVWRRIIPSEMILSNEEERKVALFLMENIQNIPNELNVRLTGLINNFQINDRSQIEREWKLIIKNWFFGEGFSNWLSHQLSDRIDLKEISINIWRQVVHKIWLNDWIQRKQNNIDRDPQDAQWFSEFMESGLKGLGTSAEELKKQEIPFLKIKAASSTIKNFLPGGIDFNTNLLDLQIKRDGKGIPLPIAQQPLESMNIEGFLPVIINISPVQNLPMLLGLADDFDSVPISVCPDDEGGDGCDSVSTAPANKFEEEILL
ncbi:hypothetical protein MNBD_UNCLBAC01-712 [hydrothermal vent metagenome]|uniref:Uncharacterized protein n=1 Tax=hydrothermal vent metagenome TaxID=652676 RepID=A0A3B1D835_9ZZZZ